MNQIGIFFVDLLCITENANNPSHFPDIRLQYIFVCGVLLVATLLSFVVLQYWICTGQYNTTLAHLLTIHGSNSYQDIRQNPWNLIKQVKLVLIQ